MKPRITLLLVFQFVFLFTQFVRTTEVPAAEVSSANTNQLANAEIKTMLQDYIDTDKLGVALVIGIVDEHGGRVIGHGKLDNGTSKDVDGDTVFEIGSITKVFTALLLQDMVERGEMRLDDPVQKYLPASVRMPTYQGKEITLLHLATHTSGLPAAPNNLSPPTWRNPDPQDVYSEEQLHAFLSQYQMTRAPGLIEAYSNVGMQLLGYAIARKAHKSYEELVIERICWPLGMADTRVTLTAELRSRLAIGHSMPGARVAGMNFVLPGAGGLLSTANDLLKFISAYSGRTTSSLDSLMQKAMAFHTLESGGKLMLAWGGNNSSFGHNGGTYGYKAIVAFDPKTRRGIIVLSSCRNSALVDAITGPLWDGHSARAGDTISLDPAVYDLYVGQYHTNRTGTCDVRREGKRLLLRWIGPSGERYPTYEVFPHSDTIFRNEFWGVQATFCPGDDGQSRNLVLTSFGPYSGFKEPLLLRRSSTNVPLKPDLVRLDSMTYGCYVGQYRKALLFGLFHVGPTLSILRETDNLGDHLIGRAKGVPGYSDGEFFPVNENSFIVNPMSTSDDIRLTFVRNKGGRASAVEVYWDGKRLRGARISKKPAS